MSTQVSVLFNMYCDIQICTLKLKNIKGSLLGVKMNLKHADNLFNRNLFICIGMNLDLTPSLLKF